MSETHGWSRRNFLKSVKVRNPVPMDLAMTPLAVGHDGHLSWQAVERASATLRGRANIRPLEICGGDSVNGGIRSRWMRALTASGWFAHETRKKKLFRARPHLPRPTIR